LGLDATAMVIESRTKSVSVIPRFKAKELIS
jgi:hypothetical protein